MRDQLLGRTPKDYDVASDAPPEEVRKLFGRRRTLAIGQAFGVITVLGPREAGQIEIAAFRQDGDYSDGRHPDEVIFGGPEEDAARRDFTINGLFFDPLEKRVIDYVQGQDDLQKRLVRAIGDPHQRIEEDKLRMLRAVRFASVFEFAIEAETLAAIRQRAQEIHVVSGERIAAELRKMLAPSTRAVALRLLKAADLLRFILPEADLAGPQYEETLRILESLPVDSFPLAWAALLRNCGAEKQREKKVSQIGRRLKLSNEEINEAVFVLRHQAAIRSPHRPPWPRLQRILIEPRIASLLDYCQAAAAAAGEDGANVAFCRERLQWPAEQLNPSPLLTGDDLRAAGLPPGPLYRQLLEGVRDEQLEGRLSSPEEALQWALAFIK